MKIMLNQISGNHNLPCSVSGKFGYCDHEIPFGEHHIFSKGYILLINKIYF